jgi:hypothetical protein
MNDEQIESLTNGCLLFCVICAGIGPFLLAWAFSL